MPLVGLFLLIRSKPTSLGDICFVNAWVCPSEFESLTGLADPPLLASLGLKIFFLTPAEEFEPFGPITYELFTI